MKKLLLICILIWSNSYSQNFKFRFVNLANGQIVNDIVVIPEFESIDYISSPLVLSKSGNYFFYKNDSYPTPSSPLFSLKVAKPDYYFPNGNMITDMIVVNTKKCNNNVCEIGVLPTVKVNFISNDILSKEIIIKLNVSCDKIGEKFFFNDKELFINSSCESVNDSTSQFKILLMEHNVSIYHSCNDSLFIAVKSFGNDSYVEKGFFLSSVDKELYINVSSLLKKDD